MTVDHAKSRMTRRQEARDRAVAMYPYLRVARAALGPRPSLRKLAYHVTGQGYLSATGKRWAAQTMSDVIDIADIQRESSANDARIIADLYPHYATEWRAASRLEIAEAEEVGETIRSILA